MDKPAGRAAARGGGRMTALLNVDGLAKTFGGLMAVNRLSFGVDEGEIFGLIGSNGSGKTTTFNLVSGFYRPDAGDITFGGRRVIGLMPHEICHLGLTRTFQIPQPFAQLTVLENTMVGAFTRTRHVSEARGEAVQILELLGLGGRLGQSAGSLSIPELKRLELAKALATQPKMLLLDEVMAGLNAADTMAMIELVRRINERGVTLLIIEHVMKAIMSLSHRVCVIHHGEKIAEGPPKNVARDPRVIQTYLGEEYVGA